ncbi:MAG: hypothetical protein A2W91_12685 [Bacteroidetes bacterium GWF2_38_335]|nr:MAG: hypothetical protein A2W91_12685 [Bacteroidetes bacterium GWF2_38_335]OFY77023.1 MAG: hypothetical protein A2281_00800 [Bacteroidetes bacterium RIFOXYA12_FULL_38_20]HBS86881.1 hypothetical protein [Bacteroidales bacterium]
MQLKKSHLLLTIALLLFQPCAAQYDSDSSFIPPQATELGWKTFHPGDVSVPIDACGDSLLHVLFPGKFHKEISFSDDTISMIYWLCHECKPVLSVYDYMPDFSEYVPDSAWNTTVELFDTLIISETGHFRFFFFYQTTEMFPEFCGRFRGANIGAALFKEENGRWKLKNFNPVLGSFGSFGRPPAPQIIKTGNNFIFFLTYANGGAGGVYTGITNVFLVKNDTFFNIHKEDFVSLFNTEYGEWFTNITSEKENEISFVTTGIFNGGFTDSENETEFILQFAPEELKEKLQSARKEGTKLNFTLKRTFYIFNEYLKLIDTVILENINE